MMTLQPETQHLSQLMMALATMAVLAFSLGANLYLYLKFPSKRWRFLALLIWLGLSMSAHIAMFVFTLTTALPVCCDVFWLLHVMNRTLDIIGWLAVGVTACLIASYYSRIDHG